VATCERYCREIEEDCLFIVDGALSRKSPAGGGLTESVILVAGAANAPSLEELAIETARQVLFLTLPSVEEKENKIFSEVMEKFPGHRAIFLSQCDTTGKTIRARSLPLASVIGEGKTIADEFRKDDTALLLRGAITDNVLEYLLSDSAFVGMTLVAEDGTRFFLSDKAVRQLRQRSVEFAVLSDLSLPLICVNPMRRDGTIVEREDILEAIMSVVDVPVCELGPSFV
jgi:hypothetical protein